MSDEKLKAAAERILGHTGAVYSGHPDSGDSFRVWDRDEDAVTLARAALARTIGVRANGWRLAVIRTVCRALGVTITEPT